MRLNLTSLNRLVSVSRLYPYFNILQPQIFLLKPLHYKFYVHSHFFSSNSSKLHFYSNSHRNGDSSFVDMPPCFSHGHCGWFNTGALLELCLTKHSHTKLSSPSFYVWLKLFFTLTCHICFLLVLWNTVNF